VRTFTRIVDGTADPPSFLAYLLEPIEGAAKPQLEGGELAGIEAVDRSTLQIRLAPRPGLPAHPGPPEPRPTPTGGRRGPRGVRQQPIGNGPFAMAGPVSRKRSCG
jgi:ABC-type oligopeptide transport system substrate-binding subunit